MKRSLSHAAVWWCAKPDQFFSVEALSWFIGWIRQHEFGSFLVKPLAASTPLPDILHELQPNLSELNSLSSSYMLGYRVKLSLNRTLLNEASRESIA